MPFRPDKFAASCDAQRRTTVFTTKDAPKGGGAAGLPQTPQSRKLKCTDSVDTMISKGLRDLPFSRNQPLKSTDNQ
jgi:hypothetical protein